MNGPAPALAPAFDDSIGGDPLAVGTRFTRQVTIDAASVREFATLCGDRNPLHHDEAAGAASPFGALIACGPQVSSLLMGLDATFFSQRHDALGLGFEFRFAKAVRAGTALTLEWTITGCAAKPSLAGTIVSVEGRAVDADGTVYVTAQGRNLLRERSGEQR